MKLTTRRISLKDFEKHPSWYLRSHEPIEIEHDSEIMGTYYPTKKRKDPEEMEKQFAAFDEAVDKFLEETGMTRDELADALDLTKPFPYETDC